MSLRKTSWVVSLLLVAGACGSESDNGGNAGASVAGIGGGVGATGGSAGVAGNVAGMTGGSAGIGGGGGVAGNVVPTGGVGGPVTGGSGAIGGEAGGGPDNCDSTVKDLWYSPGGDAPLPFPCEPFHPTTNNPYAVRCVDAWDWYDSGFPGDDFCILPPPPDKGIQYGVHPQGKEWFAQMMNKDLSGYSNVNDDFLLEVGGEEELNYYTSAGNPAEVNFYRNYPRMRAGSHHMIVNANPKNPQLEVWGVGSAAGLFTGTGLPGAQRPDENNPKSLEKPPEDAGYYGVLPADTGVTFDMHHFNATDTTILKEAWTNVWFEPDATKRVSGLRGLDLVQVATMNIVPQSTVDYHYTMSAPERVRIVTLFGHRHAWTTNFSAWIERNGENEIMYQSFHWTDEPTYRYDSVTMNPMPNHATLTDGAASGIRWLEPGELLHFNCRIQYTDARADAVNSPVMPDEHGPLNFANEAFTAEMCILFGQTAEGPALNAPAPGAGALPDFATAE